LAFGEIEDIVSSEIWVRISKALQFFDATPFRKRVVEDMEVTEELAALVDDHTEVGRTYGFGGMVEEFRR